MFQIYDNILGIIPRRVEDMDIMRYLISCLIDKYGCVFNNYYHIVEIYTKYDSSDNNYHLYFSNGTFNFDIYHLENDNNYKQTYIYSKNYEYAEDIISKIVTHFEGGFIHNESKIITKLIPNEENKECKEQMEKTIISEPLYYSEELKRMGIEKIDNFMYDTITDGCIDKNISFDRLKLAISIFDHLLKIKNIFKVSLKKTSIRSFIDENDYFKSLYSIMSQLVSLKKMYRFIYTLNGLPYDISLLLINNNEEYMIEFDNFVKDNDKIVTDLVTLYKQLAFIQTKQKEDKNEEAKNKSDIINYKDKLANEILDLDNPNSMFSKYIKEKQTEALQFKSEMIAKDEFNKKLDNLILDINNLNSTVVSCGYIISKLNSVKSKYGIKAKKVRCINDNGNYLIKNGYIYYTDESSIDYQNNKSGISATAVYYIDEGMYHCIGRYPTSYFEEVIDNEEDFNNEDTY